jgi:Mor family transcriptional regulator
MNAIEKAKLRRTEIAKLYAEDTSQTVRTISNKYGVSLQRIQQILHQEGVPMRPAGGVKGRAYTYRPRKRKVLPNCLNCGQPVKTLGRKFCSPDCRAQGSRLRIGQSKGGQPRKQERNQQILERMTQGKSQAEIGREFGLAGSRIHQIKKLYGNQG